MKTWTLWLSGSFAATILLLAVAAGWRAAPAPAAAAAPADGRWWDGAPTREFESHYDAVFPVRTLGINVWAAISYVLFREGKPGVVVGRNDWLYTSEEFNAPADAEAQVEAHLVQIATARERLAANGTALVLALVPAKARIYPEPLDGRQPAAVHETLYARALAAALAVGATAPDLQRALGACKAGEPVFLRTDTHWTPAGARCAAVALAAAARKGGLARAEPGAFRTTVDGSRTHRGDLLAFLPLDPWFADLLPAADLLETHRTEAVTDAGRGAARGLLDDAPAPEIVLVGTSYSANADWNFAGALRETFGEDVVSYATPAHGPFLPMRDYLASTDFQSAPPRLVIWEMPERYLPMRDDDGATQTTPEGKAP